MDQIETPRLLLRRARTDDLTAIHAILSDSRAMHYWSTEPHATIDQTRDWLASMSAAPPETSDDYVVEFEGRVIGKAGCWRLPEIGFILHPDVWRRGIASEALIALIAAIFARCPISKMVADVDPRNHACLGLLTRLGFRKSGFAERTYEVGGEYCDSVYLALDRPGQALFASPPSNGESTII